MTVIEFNVDQESVNKAAEGGGGVWSPFPEGAYHLRAISHEVKAPKTAGKFASLHVKFECVGSASGESVGKKTGIFFSLSPKAIPYFLIPYLKSVGVQYEIGERQTSSGPTTVIAFDPSQIEGSVALAKCKHESSTDPSSKYAIRETWSDWEASELDPMNAAGGVQSAAGVQAAPQAAPQMAPQAAPMRTGVVPPRTAGFGGGIRG